MSTRNYQPGDSYGIGFTTKSSTGALVNADSLPTASLVRNGAVDGSVAVTVTNNGTGDYSTSCTLPSGYAAGDRVSLKVLATIGGVATGEYVDHIRLVGWPNTVGAAGCLPIVNAAGNVGADLQTIKAQSVTASAGVTFPASIGTSTFAAGGSVNATQLGGQALTVAAPVTILASVGTATTSSAQSGDSFARLGAPVSSSISADIQTRSTYAGGAVASVTGAVGSVTAPVTLPTNPPAAYATAAAQASLASAVGAISVPTTSAITTAVVAGMASAPVGSVASAVTLPTTPPAGYGGGAGGGSSILANNGLDSIVVESGINARQALSLILAMVAGNDSGVGTTSLQFKAAGSAGSTTTRVTFAIDSSGNRTATLNSPT